MVVVYSERTSKPFLESLRLYGDETLPHEAKDKKERLKVVKQKGKGLGDARREGVSEALNIPGVEVFVMTEPEKVSLSERENLLRLVEPVLSGEAEMTIPDRGIRVSLKKKKPEAVEKGEDLRGYEPYQAYSEVRFNTLVHNKILVSEGLRGKNDDILDLIGGTRVFRKDLAYLFLIDWKVREGAEGVFDSQKGTLPSVEPSRYLSFYGPVIQALSLGKRVLSVPISYRHPQEQTKFEERRADYRKKRWGQLHGILPELAEVARFAREVKRNKVDLEDVLKGEISVDKLDLSPKVRLVPRIVKS